MSVRTKGSLNGFTIRPETTYGTFATGGTSKYAGTLVSLDPGDNLNPEQDPSEDSLIFSDVVFLDREFGFTAKFRHPKSSTWYDWITYAVGALTGVQKTLPSFSARVSVGDDENLCYVGCKVNQLTISADSVGGLLNFSADIYARYLCAPSATSAFVNVDTTAITFTPLSKPAYAPITNNGYIYVSTDGGTSWTSVRNKGFTIDLGTSLQREAELVNSVPLSAGLDSIPQTFDGTVTFNRAQTDRTWDELKLAGTKDLQFRIVIDGATVLMTGCYLSGDDLPSRQQSTYDESITATIRDITVTVG
ncbi:MAG: hypothetical protein WCR24_04760 [Candidatus Methanomethylophilaceae archaeon]